ncbi:MAG: hypothetical protein IH627_15900 [Rubrivivax sp.]|nr:hypothetical protein [Rubrivivax sp.]
MSTIPSWRPLLLAWLLALLSPDGTAQQASPFTAGIDGCDNIGTTAAAPRLPRYSLVTGAIDLPLVFAPGLGWFRVRLDPGPLPDSFRLVEATPSCEAHPSPASYLSDTGEALIPEIEAVDHRGVVVAKYEGTLTHDPATDLFFATRVWDFIAEPRVAAAASAMRMAAASASASATEVPAVELTEPVGPYAAGDRIPLSRIQGGRIVPAESGCAHQHLHGSITIDGSGPYADPHPSQCGFGAIVATDPEAPTSVVAGSVPAGTEYCGPDVTDIFFDRMRVMVQRLAALPDSEKGLFDGTLFLARNGGNMDFEVGAVRDPQGNAVCPTQQCRGLGFTSTFTLCGQCMLTHIDNDIEFGVVAQLLAVPRSVQLAGAHAWDLWQRQALDPLPSQAAYLVGNVLGAVLMGMPQIPNSQLCALLGAVSLRTGVLTYTNAYAMIRSELTAFGKGACQPCPHGCPEVLILKDFATQAWGLDNGGQAVYQPPR